MAVAFLVTSPYQLFHYKWIAQHFDDVAAILELRDTDFGLTEEKILQHIPHAHVEHVAKSRLAELDGRFEAIVCQTPILPLEFLDKSYVVAQQYSLTKESYQYGLWRAHAHLNLMYGPYSAGKVKGFSNAVAVGNPLLDPLFVDAVTASRRDEGGQLRVLYMPTYGELSSIDSVFPRLRDIDADITVKLHHAQDRAALPAIPPNARLVYSDSDSVALLRAADVVVSDFSGAAYDAFYAGLPVILTGAADPASQDYRRLSADEREAHALREVASWWQPGSDFGEALAGARRLIDTPRRQELLTQYFVNPGRAGEACAEQIKELLERGVPPHFGAAQVRENTKRYIITNRELRAQLKAAERKRPTRRSGRDMARAGYGRARRFLARSQTLRKLVRTIRGDDRHPSLPELPVPPAEHREAVWKLLQTRLASSQLRVARENESTGATVAVLEKNVPALQQAIAEAGKARGDLEVRVYRDLQVLQNAAASAIKLADLREGEWLRIGTKPGEHGYRVGLDSHLTILIVRRDLTRNRYLTLNARAERVDWTEMFADDTRAAGVNTESSRGPVVIGTTRDHAAAPIDVVYTWVDSTDPAWREQYQRHCEGHVAHHESANNEERFIDRQELRYSMRSVWMFAPFVRHIYLVTADQRPEWLADHPKVTVVPHKDIFPDPSALPTFNSHAIESCLHRIDGLAENFLYINDDVLLGRETDENDYFTLAGLAKVRMAPTQFIYEGRPEPDAIPTDWAAYNASQLLMRDFGMSIPRRFMHIPLPLKRSVMREIDERYPAEVERTRAARVRATTDIAIPSMFGQYYAIATARATEWRHSSNEYVYVDTGRANSLARYNRILKRRPKFFCLNVTRYDEITLADQARHMAEFMARVYPVAAPWEKPDTP